MAYDPYKALYLHIPFCVRRCGYCDFATSAVERDSPAIDEYVESLVMISAEPRGRESSGPSRRYLAGDAELYWHAAAFDASLCAVDVDASRA